MLEGQMQLFPISDVEWRERSKRLAGLVREYKRTEESKRETMKALNDMLKGLREEMDKMSDTVLYQREWRERGRTVDPGNADDLAAEEALGADGALDDDDISVTCRHCHAEFRTFATYITHRREAHPIA